MTIGYRLRRRLHMSITDSKRQAGQTEEELRTEDIDRRIRNDITKELDMLNLLLTIAIGVDGVDLTGILGGVHGGTYYKSPALEANKTHFLTL